MEKEYSQSQFREDSSWDETHILNSGKGDLSFKGNLTINGVFSGKIHVSGTLILGLDAHLTGEIVVDDFIVFGQMVGTARVTNSVVFHPSSVFSGTLTASDAEVYGGCKLSGRHNIGKITEKEAFKPSKNSKFNMEDPSSIPDEKTHNQFRL